MYLEIDEDFPSHPKSMRIGILLGNPVAWAYVQKLWIFACKYQKDGDLTAYSVEEIEGFVGWAAADGAFYAAAVKVGFIDERDGARSLHNWGDRQGKWLGKMEADRRRKADGRATSVQRTSSGRPADVQRTNLGQSSDSPQPVQRTSSGQTSAGPAPVHRTDPVPHQTGSDLTKPHPSPARVIAGSTGTGSTTKQAQLWDAHHWLQVFSERWTAKYQKFYGAGESDAKATGRLTDLLAPLPEADRIEAQHRSGAMISEFFEDAGHEVRNARHSFVFFVARWNGLRVPREAAPAEPGRHKARKLELA